MSILRKGKKNKGISAYIKKIKVKKRKLLWKEIKS